MRLGVLAPAAPVGQIELANGVAKLRELGFEIIVHPQCAAQHFVFAGTDAERAEAFYGFATDNTIDAIWCAGGGYGATRILPLLEEKAEEFGTPPRKLLVGYSDITALHEFVRSRWNWASLHHPMPAASNFAQLDSQHLAAAVAYANRRRPPDPWGDVPMKFLVNAPTEEIRGVLVGGNLSLWAAMAGTPYAPIPVPGRIVFLEDIGESPYRLDRMMVQLLQAGTFFGVKAIVLGDFTNCEDDPNQILAEPFDGSGTPVKKALRPKLTLDDALLEIFGTLGERLGVPVATGLPVGHGPNFAPLPLGAEYMLKPVGTLHLENWSWLRG